MKIILSDAESREEHDETKYSPIGQTMAEFTVFLCLGGKSQKRIKIEMNQAFWTIVKKATFLAYTLRWLEPSELKFYGE